VWVVKEGEGATSWEKAVVMKVKRTPEGWKYLIRSWYGAGNQR